MIELFKKMLESNYEDTRNTLNELDDNELINLRVEAMNLAWLCSHILSGRRASRSTSISAGQKAFDTDV